MAFRSPDFPGMTFETLEELANLRREQQCLRRKLVSQRTEAEVLLSEELPKDEQPADTPTGSGAPTSQTGVQKP